MRPVTRRLLWAVAAAALAVPALVLWRGYPWRLALIPSAAVGALTYITLNTVAQLRQQFRRRP